MELSLRAKRVYKQALEHIESVSNAKKYAYQKNMTYTTKSHNFIARTLSPAWLVGSKVINTAMEYSESKGCIYGELYDLSEAFDAGWGVIAMYIKEKGNLSQSDESAYVLRCSLEYLGYHTNDVTRDELEFLLNTEVRSEDYHLEKDELLKLANK